MSYTELLDARVVAAAARASTLEDLAVSLGSVYPPVLLESISRLEKEGRLSPTLAGALRTHAVDGRSGEAECALPVPHPLDADWRLTRASQDAMAERLMIRNPGPILLLGTPTIHARLARIEPCTLVDANPALSGALPETVITDDVASVAALNPRATAVLADPPWYPHDSEHFLWYASASAAFESLVYLSFPGELTRPGIPEERLVLIRAAEDFGLELLGFEERVLVYDTPPFESASLRAVGLNGFSRDWRRGDLLTFAKRSENRASRPTVRDRPIWIERQLFGVRLRFRMPSGVVECIDPIPRPLGHPDAVRRTVSARDPLLQRVDLWTSGNQIFACNDTESLLVIADAFESAKDPFAKIEALRGRRLVPHERELVEIARERLRGLLDADLTRTHRCC